MNRSLLVPLTAAAFLLLTAIMATAESVAVDWSTQVGGQPPLSSENLLVTLGSGEASTLVVSASTDPTNPLADELASLHVENDLEAGDISNQTRLWWRMLPSSSASSGAIAFSFRLVEGGFHVLVGNNPAAFSPGDPASIQLLDTKSTFLTMRLITDEPVMINAKNFQSDSAVVLMPDTDYSLRIHWNFDATPPEFEISLNDERLTPIEGSDLLIPAVNEIAVRLGINSFALSSTHARKSRYFLGPIRFTSD